jgi:beta-glucosidase
MSSTRYLRILLLIAVVALVAAPVAAAGDGARAPYENASLPVNKRVADLLSRMTLEEKVGQMTQTERQRIDPNDEVNVSDNDDLITKWNLGSILSGGGSTPPGNTPEAWADMIDRYQRAALATRLHIPLLYGIDSVHGDGNMLGATVFPHNIGLGATRDPELVREAAHITASETRSSGPQWTFAPCICAARDDRWGRTYESFGEDPRLVERMETAIDGFQGSRGQLGDRDRVLATAKHFAGDGDTRYGTGNGDYAIDQGIAVTSRKDFWNTSLRQYVPAVQDHHVGSVMPSYSSVDWTEDGVGNPLNMHGHRELITDVLKGKMHFDGFVISDYEGINHITGGDRAFQIRTGVNAGIDMMMEPNKYQEFETVLLDEVAHGRVSMSRVDDAVSRILTKKFQLGLFEHPFTNRADLGKVGSPAHRAVARRAVAKSQVLLKNKRDALPVNRRDDLYVAGSNADNIGNQAGGWTLTWQGGSTNVIPGQTILDGIRSAARGDVTYSKGASAPVGRQDTGVVVVGETPYSEGFGDVGGPQWGYDPGDHGVLRPPQTMQLNDADKAAVDKVCAAAKKCVVVVVSGRPLILDPARLSKIDGLVAAWLPGSEGAGVADTLFGRRPFTGKLPVTWPRTLAQEPINVGDASYDPLYPFGFGLRTR